METAVKRLRFPPDSDRAVRLRTIPVSRLPGFCQVYVSTLGNTDSRETWSDPVEALDLNRDSDRRSFALAISPSKDDTLPANQPLAKQQVSFGTVPQTYHDAEGVSSSPPTHNGGQREVQRPVTSSIR